MKKLTFNIFINAPVQIVWDNMWSEEGYPAWTAAFCEGSHAQSTWQQGSEILFLDGTGQGMFSTIKIIDPAREMTFEHHGEIVNGERQNKDWAGALEQYLFTECDGGTELEVIADTDPSFVDFMQKTFPKALQLVKEMCERKAGVSI